MHLPDHVLPAFRHAMVRRSMASARKWCTEGGAYTLIRVLRALSRATSLSPSQQQEHRKQRQQRRMLAQNALALIHVCVNLHRPTCSLGVHNVEGYRHVQISSIHLHQTEVRLGTQLQHVQANTCFVLQFMSLCNIVGLTS